MAGREVLEYINLSDPKDKKWGNGKGKIDDEDITFQRMVTKDRLEPLKTHVKKNERGLGAETIKKKTVELPVDPPLGEYNEVMCVIRDTMGMLDDLTCTENARLEDAQWLLSLSEPELDLLVSLKELVINRTKHAGIKDLGERFNLRMLRVLGSILVEYLKERMQSMSEFPNILTFLSHCGLANIDNKKIGSMASSEDKDLACATPRRKRMWEGSPDLILSVFFLALFELSGYPTTNRPVARNEKQSFNMSCHLFRFGAIIFLCYSYLFSIQQ